MNAIKISVVVLMIVVLQLISDWLVPLTLSFLIVGFIMDEYIVLTLTLTGFLVNGIPTLYTYFLYRETAEKITQDLSIVLGNIDATAVLIVSLLIPTLMYFIAGIFAWQVSEIRRKLTA